MIEALTYLACAILAAAVGWWARAKWQDTSLAKAQLDALIDRDTWKDDAEHAAFERDLAREQTAKAEQRLADIRAAVGATAQTLREIVG